LILIVPVLTATKLQKTALKMQILQESNEKNPLDTKIRDIRQNF